MQLFILAENPVTNAKFYVNKHVCKIQTEIAQMVSTVYSFFPIKNMPDFLYKPTHENHPCNLWIRKSLSNFKYAIITGICLHNEYNYRYPENGKYKQELKIFTWAWNNLPKIPELGVTPFVRAIDIEKYPHLHRKDIGTIEAYHEYYILDKKHLFSRKRKDGKIISGWETDWAKREIPYWIQKEIK